MDSRKRRSRSAWSSRILALESSARLHLGGGHVLGTSGNEGGVFVWGVFLGGAFLWLVAEHGVRALATHRTSARERCQSHPLVVGPSNLERLQ